MTSPLVEALRDPIVLTPNRISRFYRGGRLMDAFRGLPAGVDDDRPEDWLGSATATWQPPGATAHTIRISRVELDGRRLPLDEVLRAEPRALTGGIQPQGAAPSLGMLVKLIDAAERLPVHCHPTRPQAARLLGSPFGKTEAWIVLGTRDVGPPPVVWAGFELFRTDAPGDLRQHAGPSADHDGLRLTPLLGPAADPYFRALRVEITGLEVALPIVPSFAVGVAIGGRGSLRGRTRSLPLARGTTFALAAAAIPSARVSSDGAFEAILCLPAEPTVAGALS
ncbi:MAG: hypothetical protein M3153_05275 [Chloroflexota bacterium]|nr:hypothetical protein [Chloroflexota bacterium]